MWEQTPGSRCHLGSQQAARRTHLLLRREGCGAECDESSELLPDSPVVDGVEERLAGRLTCSLETEAVIWRSRAGEEPATVAVTASDTTVIKVSLAPDDPTLTYHPEAWTLGAPPS
jgi:hypothetical protein